MQASIFLKIFLGISTFWVDYSYKFKEDFQKDQQRLQQDHNFESRHLDKFERFKELDLSDFHWSTTTKGSTIIKKWSRNNGDLRQIYQIESEILVDTLEEKYQIKGTFQYRIYIFILANEPRKLTYQTEQKAGLQAYSINGKRYYPTYESIDLGIEIANSKAKAVVEKILQEN